jgi:cyclophilin family peptidyl-prolyl cis-trans isomerase
MNILTDVRYFAIVGVFVVAAMVFAAILTQANSGPAPSDLPDTPTPAEPTADPNATATATAVPTEPPLSFTEAEQVIDAAVNDYVATVSTSRGDIVIHLFAAKSPNTVNSFVFLAQEGFFDGITFHRVEPEFVVQAGDPTGTGVGGPGYQTELEETDLLNTRGAVAMARAGTSTAFGSQFFINLVDNASLDQQAGSRAPFYPFGEVIEGMDVVDQIQVGDLILAVNVEESPR